MRLHGLLPLIETAAPVAALRARLHEAAFRQIAGVSDAAKPVLLATLLDNATGPVLIVTPRPDRAEAMAEEVALYLTDPSRVLVFPELDTIPYERVTIDVEAAEARLRVLKTLAEPPAGAPPLVITSGMALAQRTLAPAERRAAELRISVSDRLQLPALLTKLQTLGYEAVSLVETPGHVSRRGGIVDIFPPAEAHPYRIEFFGDQVDSLRTFDVSTQRTVAHVQTCEIGPAREASAERATVDSLLAGIDFEDLPHESLSRYEEEFEQLRAGDLGAGAGFYLPFLARALVLDYLPSDALVVTDEPADTLHALDELDAQAEEARAELERRHTIPRGLPLLHADRRTVASALDARVRRLELHRWATSETPGAIEARFAPPDTYGGRLRVAMHSVLDLARGAERVVITSQQSARLAELFRGEGRDLIATEELAGPPSTGAPQLVHGSVGNGWSIELPDGRLSLITDAEIFGFTKQRRPQRARAGNRDAFLADLAPGDYVVHVEHGIAVFQALVRRLVDGVEREYLELHYADGDKLLVPTDQVDRVTRYVGPSDRTPSLTRLGTSEWARVKERVRRAVTDLAQDLLNLYAAREIMPGRAFSPDQPWQQELEASFPYVETQDQLRAIADVKSDMETPRPMDRVIVGDVGYGKTEVAIRAAFKAVLDGTQVAVLVPTTVLAQQHLQTFRERLSGFPTSVDVLSRFRSDKEAKEVIDSAASGGLDILIGTHRLLQKGVSFSNLGLVIIDEEQRFGVAHKERLKQLRQQVDVLTLSATPIPRTLHMSLSGIRDMSTMTTAPEDRLPNKTFVAEFDERLIREAILRELDRGGLVYFVHNRVNSIERIAAELRTIVPEAQIAVGHGQMPEDALEQVMVDFQRGQYDVLVCTTIIESGLDIPSVNTIIINQSDRLGLSQLYQLRGRVGRGANRAYAYLLYDRNRSLTETAQKRLQTIFEATELGAGFQIALRDLEIRGAGNLLGVEQSGHIGAVGFDLYSRMLGDAVQRLRAMAKGEEPPLPASSLPAVQLDLPLPAYIPESYVVDLNVRLALYQRMGQVTTPDEAQALFDELVDRFGAPPPAVRGLLYALALKSVARDAGFVSILLEEGEFVLRRATPIENREAILRRSIRGVQVGTTQVRVAAGAGWIERLYGVVCAAVDNDAMAPPSFAADLEAAAQRTAAVPTPDAKAVWERPSQTASPRPGPFPSRPWVELAEGRAGASRPSAARQRGGRRRR
ncbi:MAG: transcription-repair coupling factor [Dehalococcoidia bacterium]